MDLKNEYPNIRNGMRKSIRLMPNIMLQIKDNVSGYCDTVLTFGHLNYKLNIKQL